MQTSTTTTTKKMLRRRSVRAVLAPAALLAALFTAGCASTGDEPVPALQAAEARFEELRSTPRVEEFARRNLRDAERNLQLARTLAEEGGDREEIEHYSFLASSHLDIAEARLNRGLTQEEISTADRRRQELMLAAEQRRAEQQRTRASEAEQRADEAEARLALAQSELEQTRAAAQNLAAELDELKVQQEERGTVLTLSDVVFDFDSDQLNPGGQQTLARVAETLSAESNAYILVEGYTDAVGSESYNQALSERRAKAVKAALVKGGLPEERIDIAGHGEAFPVASNDTPQGRQMNRRVEIVISNTGEPAEPRST
ncbi:MAG TPA: OmpA family protein [Pseudomonadales bacterium]